MVVLEVDPLNQEEDLVGRWSRNVSACKVERPEEKPFRLQVGNHQGKVELQVVQLRHRRMYTLQEGDLRAKVADLEWLPGGTLDMRVLGVDRSARRRRQQQ